MEDHLLDLAAYAYLYSSYIYFSQVQRTKIIKKKRRWWMVKIHKSRERYDGRTLLADLVHEPGRELANSPDTSGEFANFCRMSSSDFELLLQKIGPSIQKKDTDWRKAISIKVRLAVTLRFLATGDTYRSLHYLFKISSQVISKIVPEVCQAIITVLQDEVKMPNTRDGWIRTALEFEERWQFPQCLGAIDGKHVLLQSPIHSGTEFYNYKNSFSIVLLAIVDSNYCFSFADVGCQGRMSDGGVFMNSDLMNKVYGNNTHFPNDKYLPGRNMNVPFVFVADLDLDLDLVESAFALSTRIMKPYPGTPPRGSSGRIFNTRLSRARVVVENAFGIMSSVFRVFKAPMLLQPEKATTITLTCIYLHNFLRKSRTSKVFYAPEGCFDYIEDGELREGTWRQHQLPAHAFRPIERVPIRPPLSAIKVRDEYANYFCT